MSRRSLAIVVSIQVAALTAVSLLIGDNGWDDGAITLAFSRTFARAGRIALTPHSETVEGFSSVAWFVLNALPARLTASYSAAIIVSQLLAVVCMGASTLLLARTCALLRFDRLSTMLTVVGFAAWGCSFGEASNGMEMGLLAVALLVMVNELLSPEPRRGWLAAGVVLAIATRFEAVLYVGLLALGALSVSRRAFRCIAVAGVAAVLLLTVWRLAVFGDVLPNTFWAKRWPPYAEFGFTGRLIGAVELPSFFIAPLIVLGAARATGFDLRGALRSRRRAVAILAGPILGAIVAGALIGKHWGYWGRMPTFAFPLALALIVLALSAWVNARRSAVRVAIAVGALALALVTSMTGFPAGALAAARAGGSFGVTPHTYAASGQVFRRFAAAAALQRPTILSPDLGGLALRCDEFRVVDLGMLSNRTLARRGPAALADVLEAESPEIIEAHWQWASLGGLYELPSFRARYLPAFAGGTKLWLRRDVAQAIEAKRRGCWLATTRTDVQHALVAHRYANHDVPDDRTAFERGGKVLALNEADPIAGNLCNRSDSP